MKVLIIIPAYNEEESIEKTVATVTEKVPFCDYVVINDGSTDRTGAICRRAGINHITLIENLGIGGAVQTGYKYARDHGYDYAIQIDGDGQHDPLFIPALLKVSEEGVNLVVGSRFIKHEGFQSSALRRIGIRFYAGLVSLLGRSKVTDTTSGMRVADKSVIALFAERYPADFPETETVLTVLRRGLSVKEVPVVMKERAGGVTSITPIKSIYFMLKVTIALVFAYMTEKPPKTQ